MRAVAMAHWHGGGSIGDSTTSRRAGLVVRAIVILGEAQGSLSDADAAGSVVVDVPCGTGGQSARWFALVAQRMAMDQCRAVGVRLGTHSTRALRSARSNRRTRCSSMLALPTTNAAGSGSSSPLYSLRSNPVKLSQRCWLLDWCGPVRTGDAGAPGHKSSCRSLALVARLLRTSPHMDTSNTVDVCGNRSVPCMFVGRRPRRSRSIRARGLAPARAQFVIRAAGRRGAHCGCFTGRAHTAEAAS